MIDRWFKMTRRLFFCGAAITASALPARSAHAATVNVTANCPEVLRDGKCGIAEAMKAVNNHATFDACTYSGSGADKIVVPAGTYTETTTLSSSRSVTVQGAGLTTVIKGAVQNAPLFDFSEQSNGISVVLSGVELINNASGSTGISSVGQYGSAKLTIAQSVIYGFDSSGISASGVNLDVEDSSITNNSAPGGGGITCDGSLIVNNSSISNNTADFGGGGIYFGGFGVSKITNSTISFNSSAEGGGIYLANIDEMPTDSFAITASTIAFNSGDGVKALAQNYNLRATIVANNTDVNFAPSDWRGPIASLTDSILMSTAGTTIGSQSHNLLDTDPQLFGGSNAIPVWVGGVFYVPVVPLGANSPAIDFVSSVGGATQDARHFPRGISGGTGRSTLFDIGAMEYDAHFQGETLLVIPSQSGPHLPTVAADSNFSNGQASQLAATGTGDFVTYQIPIYHDFTAGQPGQVRVRVKKSNNEGIVKISWAHLPPQGQPFVWTTLGSVDLYSATPWYGSTAVGARTNFNTDATYFKFQITGKNSASSGFQMFLDYIDVIQ